MLHLIEALNALAEALESWPKEVPDADLAQLLPTTAHVTAAKADDPVALAEGFGEVLAFELAPLIAEASTAGLLIKARTIGRYTGPARATDVTATIGDRAVKPGVDSWTRRLRLTGRAAALVAEIATLPVPAPPPAPVPAAFKALARGMVSASNVRARASSIREAIDVLSRWVAAHRAASTFGGGHDVTSLMLALYRTEGDLSVPRSQRSLDALIPAHIESDLQSSRASNSPKKLLFQFGYNSLVHAADRPEPEGTLKLSGLALWALHIGGHDRLVDDLPAGIVDFATMWSAASPATPMTAASLTSKVVSLATAMTVSRAFTDSGLLKSARWSDASFATRRIRVAPEDPVAVVQLSLELAYVLFLDLSGLRTIMAGAPPTLRWSNHATYLFYNNQVQAIKSGVLTMPHRSLPASAAGSIASWPKYREPSEAALQSDFSELRTALGFIPLVDPTPTVWSSVDVDDMNGPTLETWLTTSSLTDPAARLAELGRRVELLSLFMTRAGVKQWPSCREHRANTSRFRLLLSYYTEVLSSP